MRTYIATALITLLIGGGLGLYLGWVQFPIEYDDSHMCQLDRNYQEEYTLMVARGFQQDGDLEAALERLRPLRVEGIDVCADGRSDPIDNIPSWVQFLTERYISQSRNTDAICDLAELSAAFGRLTPPMQQSCPGLA
jgi:hypothetical protein